MADDKKPENLRRPQIPQAPPNRRNYSDDGKAEDGADNKRQAALGCLVIFAVLSACGMCASFFEDEGGEESVAEAAVTSADTDDRGAGAAAAVPPAFVVVDSSLTSSPGDLRYIEWLRVETPADSASLAELLHERVEHARSLSSSWYAEPRGYSIFLMPNHTLPGHGDWLAMAGKAPVDSGPEYRFDRAAILYHLDPPGDRWGLTPTERRELRWRMGEAARRARCEADDRFPEPDPGAPQEDLQSWMDGRGSLLTELEELYEAEIAEATGTDPAVLDSIGLESYYAKWPSPGSDPC